MTELHTCSYECQRPACVLAQRDELRARAEADDALLLQTLRALRWAHGNTDEDENRIRAASIALLKRLGIGV